MSSIPEMTELSRKMFARATVERLELSEAVETLKRDAYIRTVKDTLQSVTGMTDCDTAALQTFIIGKMTQALPGENRDSVRRKVANWMKEDTVRVTRDSAVQIAYALSLSPDEADSLLKRLCEEGFHYRDPEDIVYIYGLAEGLDYSSVCLLREQLAEKGYFEKSANESTHSYTEQIRSRVMGLTSVEELESLLSESREMLGRFHNTAYELFCGFTELLSSPEEDFMEVLRGSGKREAAEDILADKKYISDAILNVYLHRAFVPVARRDAGGEQVVLSALQRSIHQNWPDEQTLSRMLNRKTDVTRKVLILLFLATDGGDSSFGNYDVEDDRTAEEIFADSYSRMNDMLEMCGFAPLDSRVRFDFMILYCMCADDSIYIDGRVQRFLSEIFPETGMRSQLADEDTAF